jgi:hypothetical protein
MSDMATTRPKLLAGGNPQIAKAEGDAPVQAYIAAMPGWKRDVGRRLDAMITSAVPGVRKAVKWNSPFYGAPDRGWFLSFHCFTKYARATSIFTKATRSTRSASRAGSVRQRSCRGGERRRADVASRGLKRATDCRHDASQPAPSISQGWSLHVPVSYIGYRRFHGG